LIFLSRINSAPVILNIDHGMLKASASPRIKASRLSLLPW